MRRRDFLKLIAMIPATSLIPSGSKNYTMVIDVDRCIGCGKCVVACKIENDVPKHLPTSRTWIEGYSVGEDVQKVVMNTVENPFLRFNWKYENVFYVPKLCNQCSNAPCVQVCPVNARFYSEGIVLVDKKSCIGCKYCVVACPYGATYVHPEEKVTDKCTFCYHRIYKGLTPVCVLLCPTGCRKFGTIDELEKFSEGKRISVLKPEKKTYPKVFYLNLDTTVIE